MKSWIVSGMLCLSALTGSCNTASARLTNTTDSTKGFAVVELFTSEGCSSCPPADELLARLEKESPGKPLYLLAFHVDYWDHQGWRDSFSQHIFSERQQQYASWLHLSNIYTPQMVINGVSEFVGSDVSGVIKAINHGFSQEAADHLSLQTKIGAQQMEVTWQLSSPKKNTRLLLALVQKNGQSHVRAGENAGRKLSHVQIVQRFTTVDINRTTAVSLAVPADFNTQSWELIGWVQNTSDGHIIAATKAVLQ
jgi:hypothetical protein